VIGNALMLRRWRGAADSTTMPTEPTPSNRSTANA
jgi:hypothetical protein